MVAPVGGKDDDGPVIDVGAVVTATAVTPAGRDGVERRTTAEVIIELGEG